MMLTTYPRDLLPLARFLAEDNGRKSYNDSSMQVRFILLGLDQLRRAGHELLSRA